MRFLELPRPQGEAEATWTALAQADYTAMSNPLDERVIRDEGIETHLYLLEPPDDA